MAGYDLIDTYLDGLRGRLRWRSDADEVIDELRDHLYSAMDEAAARSTDGTVDQQRLLARFGEQHEVATALATTPRGGVAVPTASTKSVGRIAIVAAGLWLVFPLSWLILAAADGQGDFELVTQIIFMAGTLGLIAAGGMTVAIMVGLRERLGGLGLLATVGMAFMGLGAAASVFSWFIPGWATPMAIGGALFATAMKAVGIAPRWPTIAIGSAWILGVSTWAVLRYREFGGVDEWGDYPAASLLGLITGSVIFAAGLGSLGRWMHDEEPVVLDPAEPLLPA